MSPQEIRKMLRRSPFIPFRLHVSDQSHYDIVNSEMMVVSDRTTVIVLARPGKVSFSEDHFDEPLLIDNLHVTRLEPLVPETSAT